VAPWRNPAPSGYNKRETLQYTNTSLVDCEPQSQRSELRHPAWVYPPTLPLLALGRPEGGVPGRRLFAAAHHGEDLLEISDTLRPVIEHADLGEA